MENDLWIRDQINSIKSIRYTAQPAHLLGLIIIC